MMENLCLFRFTASDNISSREVFVFTTSQDRAQTIADKREGCHCNFDSEVEVSEESIFSVTTEWNPRF